MSKLYNQLKDLPYFVDNEYLQKYVQLVEMHTRTVAKHTGMHKHHIIPKSWFKLCNVPCDDSLRNLVVLRVKEHFLAHYYLCLCTEDPFQYANELALICLESNIRKNTVDQHLLHSLPMYNNIYESYSLKLKSNYRLYSTKEKT